MRKGTFKYPDNRFGGHLPKRIPEPSETRLSDNPMTYGFNDFMTQCRHSSLVRRTASPQNRIRGDPPVCLFTETDNAVIQSACKQKIKSSTIKLNRTMSKEIFVAFATQKGGIGKSTVTALAASYLHNVKATMSPSWTATTRSTASTVCANMRRHSSAGASTSRLSRATISRCVQT